MCLPPPPTPAAFDDADLSGVPTIATAATPLQPVLEVLPVTSAASDDTPLSVLPGVHHGGRPSVVFVESTAVAVPTDEDDVEGVMLRTGRERTSCSPPTFAPKAPKVEVLSFPGGVSKPLLTTVGRDAPRDAQEGRGWLSVFSGVPVRYWTILRGGPQHLGLGVQHSWLLSLIRRAHRPGRACFPSTPLAMAGSWPMAHAASEGGGGEGDGGMGWSAAGGRRGQRRTIGQATPCTPVRFVATRRQAGSQLNFLPPPFPPPLLVTRDRFGMAVAATAPATAGPVQGAGEGGTVRGDAGGRRAAATSGGGRQQGWPRGHHLPSGRPTR